MFGPRTYETRHATSRRPFLGGFVRRGALSPVRRGEWTEGVARGPPVSETTWESNKKWRRRRPLPLARHSPSSRNPSGLPFPCGVKPSSRLRVEQSGWQVRRAPAMLVVRRAPTAAGAAPHQSPTAGARSTTSQPCSATARRRQRCGSPGAMTIRDGGISSATMLG